jgi:hypothetical protein
MRPFTTSPEETGPIDEQPSRPVQALGRRRLAAKGLILGGLGAFGL